VEQVWARRIVGGGVVVAHNQKLCPVPLKRWMMMAINWMN